MVIFSHDKKTQKLKSQQKLNPIGFSHLFPATKQSMKSNLQKQEHAHIISQTFSSPTITSFISIKNFNPFNRLPWTQTSKNHQNQQKQQPKQNFKGQIERKDLEFNWVFWVFCFLTLRRFNKIKGGDLCVKRRKKD